MLNFGVKSPEEVMRAAAARREDVEEPLRIHARLHPEHHRLRRDRDVGHRHHVVDDLDHEAGAERTDVVELGAEREEQRPDPLEHRRVAPDQEDELAVARLDRPAAYRRVEAVDAAGPGRRRDLAAGVGVDRAHVDEDGAGSGRREHPVGTQVGLTDRDRIGQAREHDVRGLRRGGRGGAQGDARGGGLARAIGAGVVAGDLVAARDEPSRHRPAHGPEPHESDRRSDGHARSPLPAAGVRVRRRPPRRRPGDRTRRPT